MIFNKTNSRYIAGWEIDYDDSKEFKKILLTQGINESGFEFFKSVQSATEMIIKNDTVVKTITHSDKDSESEKIKVRLPITDWVDRQVFLLSKDSNGNHKIGGDCPTDFKIPYHDNLKTPFVFIGTIDTSDTKFDWINLPRLDIIYPIYECNFGVFLDYSDSSNPKIINPDTFEDSWFDDSIKGVDKVVFKEQMFSVKAELDSQNYEDNQDSNLICGVPLWYQAPEIPTCPKTGKLMRFVCTINSDSSIDLKNSNGIENLPFGDYLVFGDHGNLYVFYHPDSKILYLNIQF